jgi:hypothetical protein
MVAVTLILFCCRTGLKKTNHDTVSRTRYRTEDVAAPVTRAIPDLDETITKE